MFKTFTILLTVIVVVAILGLGYLYFTRNINGENYSESNYPVKISGQAMKPNFNDGQVWSVDRTAYTSTNPQRGDVILFFKDQKTKDMQMAKRIVGLPGEEIEIKDNKIYINGSLIAESYITKEVMTYPSDFHKQNEKKTVPINNYYILGDNRPNSADSRLWGFLRKENIIGKLTTCYMNCK